MEKITVTENEHNNDKYLTGDLEELKKKRQQENNDEVLTESAENLPLQYFTE